MTVRCGIELDPCLVLPPTERVYKFVDNSTLTHKKDIDYKLTLGSTNIPLRLRKRNFALKEDSGKEKKDFILINDLQNNELECFEWDGKFSLSISESFEAIDTTIYILDPDRNHAFWKETHFVLNFNHTSNESARFNAPSNLYHKWILGGINALITVTWKLCIKGTVEEVYKESGVKPLYSAEHPLIIVWTPPTAGVCVDEEINKYGYFYDYFGQGEGLITSDGGADFYYPEWIRMATEHREEDQADARRRYDYIWGADPNRESSYELQLDKPLIYGADDPRGSIVTNAKGETLASVTVTKGDGTLLHVNRLCASDGVLIAAPETIAGDNLRYYPVGLL